MAQGRIREDDIAAVKAGSRIEAVVGEQVMLKNAGGGSLKGLCPFHDEKTPSFYVTPDRQSYKCFGCGEGGDVVEFVMRTENLPFTDAVEQLAARLGLELRREGGGSSVRSEGPSRARLVAAHAAAARYYAEQLHAAGEAETGRAFLRERGFEPDSWTQFGVGFAPGGWDVLVTALSRQGFSHAEVIAAGLAREGSRGTPIDRFRRRLVWPIRDRRGDAIGFGARKLFDDDDGPKYLNTPETALYKKSTVLYGVDLARVEIGRRRQAVVVEGYTDVMACHLAGVPTAVATCGTSFGPEHVSVLRQLMLDQDDRGEVIYTFDGDAAGRKAALRAFAEDQRFTAQTFVAAEPDGLDPCDLRLARGDAAVRDLIARRVPMFEFVIKSRLDDFDLDSAPGRVGALRALAPVVAGIRDHSLRPEFARLLAGWIGMDPDQVVAEIRQLAPAAAAVAPRPRPVTGEVSVDPATIELEREALKAAVQRPDLTGAAFDALPPEAFRVPRHQQVRDCVLAAGGTAATSAGDAAWVDRLRAAAADDQVRSDVLGLAVGQLHALGDPARYVAAVLARLQLGAATRELQELKSRVQRINPVDRPGEYNREVARLFALEGECRELRDRALGAA